MGNEKESKPLSSTSDDDWVRFWTSMPDGEEDHQDLPLAAAVRAPLLVIREAGTE